MTLEVDTIAAVATARGRGALAVVRLSGPEAHDVLRALAPEAWRFPEARRSSLVALRDPATRDPLDRAVVVRYDAPASFTGEDMVEISCHGGWLVPELILDACLAAGARAAEPGEFTRRAYLRGKVDLVQAEAVNDLVEARSRAFHRAAFQQLERGLSARVGELRSRVVHLEALLTHHIDFPEEDDAPVSLERIGVEAASVLEAMRRILATAPEGELLREGAVTVLAGLPNAGKSSLFNALLGRERAIVTEEPGTTRDALEAVVELGGYPFRLVDTAGLREARDRVEKLGVEVARSYLKEADLVLLCVEAGRIPGAAEGAFMNDVGEVPVVKVTTKVDTVGGSGHAASDREEAWMGEVDTSVVTGEGLERLRALLPELVFRGLAEGDGSVPVLTRRRQARALRDASEAVEAFAVALSDDVPPELAATHLRTAESAMEDLLGVVTVDEILDVVFGEFCFGK
ncbi:MAG: tRNA uridine-5-carboxymethylaminomethyl(34) synthesis GTPase MnmE [Gemmatimonadota bacterium]